MRLEWTGLAATLCLALLAPAAAYADRHDDGRERGGHEHEHYDTRHGHNHYYPNHGVEVRSIPRAAVVVERGGERYWFHEGVWYRPRGPRFIVVAPPIGFFVPALPPFATVVVIGGLQYYYANEAYYVYREDQRQYEIVPPPDASPPGAGPGPAPPYGAAVGSAPPPSDNLFIYPKNGQNAEQQARDRYECHRWAADQTGFDPTRPGGGVAGPESGARRGDYFRAQQACLEARGYTVR